MEQYTEQGIKVGEYIRIDKSSRFLGIGKIIKIVGNTVYVKTYTTLPISFQDEEIKKYKHSKNIIDLIEVGDVLEIYFPFKKITRKVFADEYFKESMILDGIIQKRI